MDYLLICIASFFLLLVTFTYTAIDACDVESLEPFKVIFIGNSLTGGGGVGGRNNESDRCLYHPFPWPETLPSTNPGDVPGKVKQISDAACQFDFQWNQNTRTAHFLSTHAGSCKLVNENMIAEMGADLNVLVVQAQSEELANDTCEPTSNQVANLTILFNAAPTYSKKMLLTTWAGYDAGDEICTFSKLDCTQQDVKDQFGVHLLPVGRSFQYIADTNCDTMTPCDCDSTTCGYVSNSCSTSLWSKSSRDGLFADSIHQSDASGAWLAALVVYGGMQTPVCLPPAELLAPSGLSDDLKIELATAAAVALSEEYGSNLFECFTSSPTLSPTTTEEEGGGGGNNTLAPALSPIHWTTTSPTLLPTKEEIALPTMGGGGGVKPKVVAVHAAYCTSEAPCPQCYGDCDTHDDCQGNLLCYQRDGGQTVPSCSGGEDSLSNTDYCIDPAVDTGGGGGVKPKVVAVHAAYCTPKSPCPQCYGDCDTDDGCQGNLVCYQRDGGQTVPSCSGGEDSLSNADYCIDPAVN